MSKAHLEHNYEAWITFWNNKVGLIAGQANGFREPLGLQLAQGLADQFAFFRDKLKQLRDFYLAIADVQGPAAAKKDETELSGAVRWCDENTFFRSFARRLVVHS